MNVNLKISIKSLISLNPNRLFYSRGRRPKYITTSFDNLIISITKKISNCPLPLLIERESHGDFDWRKYILITVVVD